MKRLTLTTVFALTAFLSVVTISPEAEAKIIDIKTISGKTPAEVSKVLGKPTKIEKSRPSGTGCNPCDKGIYQKGKYEVLFIGGKADWITINGVKAKFNAAAISEIGLNASATTATSDLIEWNPKGFIKVQLHGWDGQSDYFYIKVKTK
jgi:hypothetical protein